MKRRSASDAAQKASSDYLRRPHSEEALATAAVSAAAAGWSKFWIRTIWTIIMILVFAGILLAGHLAIIIMVLAIQTCVFKEVIAIAHQKSKEKQLPWFRTTMWYIFYYSHADRLQTC